MLLLHFLSFLDNLQVQVWVLAASAQRAQCGHRTDVEDWISELVICNVQETAHSDFIQSHCVSSTRLSGLTVGHAYQGNRTSPRVLFVPP